MANFSWLADDFVNDIEQKKYQVAMQFFLVSSPVINIAIFSYLL